MKWPWQKDVSRGVSYTSPLSWPAYQTLVYNNHLYPYGVNYTMPKANTEDIGYDFRGLVEGAYKSNGIVYACLMARALLFAEATFKFRQQRNGRPGPLFGTTDLEIVERPSGPTSSDTTYDLLMGAIHDFDLAGNWFGLHDGDRIHRLRPDWVTIVMGSEYSAEEASIHYDAEVVGYLYHPGGYAGDRDPIAFLPEQVAHFKLAPDPTARFRGMSWLTPIVREIMGDNAARDHKLTFFENGATVNLVIRNPDLVNPDLFKEWVELFRQQHEGAANAYKTMFLGGGADATSVGADFQQMDFKVVQGAGETRIAAAARVPPIVVGLSEGLASATYSNYGQARRAFADHTMRPLWHGFAGSLARIVNVPPGAELWYDDRDISFLQEDAKDRAEVQSAEASMMATLVKEGWTPASIVDAVTSNDWTRLVHSGLVSVQLQPPGTAVESSASPAMNGSAQMPALPPA